MAPRPWCVTAFTRGNALPRNAANSIRFGKVQMSSQPFSHRQLEPVIDRDFWLMPRRLTARAQGPAACGRLKPDTVNDAGWYTFRRVLACKAAWTGKRVEAIPPAFTTQECSNTLADGTVCGERVSKALAMRTQICPRCSYILDRDENAASTILWAGQILRGV